MTDHVRPHILIFEPRVEGHHLSWLLYIAEDLLSAGFKLTLAIDGRSKATPLIQNQLGTLIDRVALTSVFDAKNRYRGGSKISALAECLDECGAHEVFVNSLDEIASHCLRLAAIGIYPPKNLQGRLNGVYFRPRFLLNSVRPLGNLIKALGFRRLRRQKWFKRIYLMDEYLYARVEDQNYDRLFHLLPDPWDGDFSQAQDEARKALEIPEGRTVFLNYGIGDRRKGLHLVIRAMLASSANSRMFLLCAGQIKNDSEITNGLEQLKRRGTARVLNRFVSDTEEELCFCASDVVLLPYIEHFGSSGVLSVSAAAGKMVIVSDEGLIARRVREYKLGWLFASGNVRALKERMEQATSLPLQDRARFQESALEYSRTCSREVFRKALLAPFDELSFTSETNSRNLT